ncbi:hypothetical protein JHW46_04325 [Vibrio splendidus]|nr:hypothetical protein [Vibrio splendidus]
MNMNKTILATLITTAFSSNVIAQSVDVELANLATEKAIQSQMDSIDTSTLAKLNAQNNKVVELNGVVYEQDDSGVWKAIGTGALGLTAALFSGSSSSSSSGLSDIPDYEQGPIIDGEQSPSIGNDNAARLGITDGAEGIKFITVDGERKLGFDTNTQDVFKLNGDGTHSNIGTVKYNENNGHYTIDIDGSDKTMTVLSNNGLVRIAGDAGTFEWNAKTGEFEYTYKPEFDGSWGQDAPEKERPIVDHPEHLPSPDVDPEFGQKPGVADITEVAGVKLVIGDEGNIVVVGDNYAYLGDASGDYKGKGFTIESDRKLVDSQGNAVATFKVHQDGTVTINRLSIDGQEITETVKVVNIDGRLAIISHDWTIGGGEVNPEKDRPVIDHPEHLPSPDVDPDFGQKPGIADITEVAGVKLVIGDAGNIVVVGDNYAYLGDASGDYKGKGFTIENDRKLVDSQGNAVATFKVHQDGTVTINRLSTDGQEITETVKVVNIDGRLAIISHDWTIGGGEVNPEKDRPVIDHPEHLPSPDVDPDFGQKPGVADITEVAGVKLVIGDEGNIVVVGDNYAYLGDASGDYKGKGFTIENDRKLVDSQGNAVATFKVHQDGTVTINRLSTDGQEITETVKVVNIDGRLAIVSHDWRIGGGEVNPEKERPVIDHPEHLPVDGIHLVGNNLYKDGTKLGYVTTDTNKLVVNGEEVADVKTFNNLDNMFAVKGSLDDVQYTVYVTETGEVRFMKQSEFHAVVKDSIKDRITTDPDFGQGERLKNIDRSKLQNIKAKVMSKLAK